MYNLLPSTGRADELNEARIHCYIAATICQREQFMRCYVAKTTRYIHAHANIRFRRQKLVSSSTISCRFIHLSTDKTTMLRRVK